MGMLNIDEHVEEHRLVAIRYPVASVYTAVWVNLWDKNIQTAECSVGYFYKYRIYHKSGGRNAAYYLLLR
jgi:hypothetical protein